MSGRIWQVRYRDRITQTLTALDASPKDRQGRAIVRCGGAGGTWRAEAIQEDAGLRVWLWPLDPHDIDPSLKLLELPIPTEAIDG